MNLDTSILQSNSCIELVMFIDDVMTLINSNKSTRNGWKAININKDNWKDIEEDYITIMKEYNDAYKKRDIDKLAKYKTADDVNKDKNLTDLEKAQIIKNISKINHKIIDAKSCMDLPRRYSKEFYKKYRIVGVK